MSTSTDLLGGFFVVVGGVVTFIGAAILISLLAAIPTFFLWNWLMPIIFGLPKLTFIQAIGVNLLCECLFKTRESSSRSSKKKQS